MVGSLWPAGNGRMDLHRDDRLLAKIRSNFD